MRISTMAFRNLARNKRRTLLSISTLTFACIIGLFMFGLISGMKSDMKNNIISFYTGALRLSHKDFDKYDYLNPVHLYIENEKELRENLLAIKGVTAAAARTTAPGIIFMDEDPTDQESAEEFGARAWGIEFEKEQSIMAPGTLLLEGRLPRSGAKEAVMGYKLAEETGLATGDKFTFITSTAARSTNAMTFKITGMVNFPMGEMNNSRFLLPIDTMQNLMKMDAGTQEIILMTQDPEKAEILQEKIENLISCSPEYNYIDVKLWKEQGEFYSMLGIAEVSYSIMALFFLLMGATVIINSTMMVVFERYKEIGILGSLGMRPEELVRLFFLEAFFTGLMSTALGLTLGILVVTVFQKTGLNFGSAYSSMNLEISTIFYPELRLHQIILMGVYTLGITSLVTLIPSRKAAVIEPVDALRDE